MTMAAQSLSIIPKLEALSPIVFRVLGCNPGLMTLQGTNTYLVGSGKKKILIDTGEPDHPEYITNLKDALNTHLCGATIDKVICTHWHMDHVGGTEEIFQQFSSRDLSDMTTTAAKLTIFKYPRPSGVQENYEPSCGYRYIQDNHEFKTEGATLRALFTPGHTDDHICLYLVEENAVFSGDCLLGEGTAVFEDLYTYMQSLQKILQINPERIYPGHGPLVQDAKDRIEFYIKHRTERERQILQAMANSTATSATGQPASLSSEEITKLVYVGLNEHLLMAAENNVNHHLVKLEKDGKVAKNDDKWTLVASSNSNL